MKKKSKIAKILSFFMVCVMALSIMTVSVHAEELADPPTTTGQPTDKKGTLTLESNVEGADAKAGFEYSIYKVMDSYEVGTDAFDYNWTENFKDINSNPNYGSLTVDMVKGLLNGEPNHEFGGEGTVDSITPHLEKYIADKKLTSTADAKIGNPVELNYGYYLITGKTVPEGYKETKPMLVEISKAETTVTVKEQLLTIEKTIESEDAKAESAASQVGKEITFHVTYDVPKYADDQNVTFYITDTLGKGLDFVADSVNVYKNTESQDNLLPPEQYSVTSEKDSENGTTKVVFDFSSTDGKVYYTNVRSADKLIIEYKAKLNKDAVFGPAEGDQTNVNTVVPTFGKDSEITNGKEDKTKSYTGAVEIVKKDEKGENPLSGAEFTVYEADEKGEITDRIAQLVVYSEENGQTIKEIKDAVSTTDENGKVHFDGLGEGTYYIKETKSPSGYILLKEPIKVAVDVTEPPAIVTGDEKAEFTYTITMGNENLNGRVDGNRVTFDITNKKGFSLPTTGGMGTYIFTIGGIILMAAAVVLLIHSRKKA